MINESQSMEQLFSSALLEFRKFQRFTRDPTVVPEDYDQDPQRKREWNENLLKRFHRIAFHIEKANIFSSNEELDDIKTNDLKYLIVPFAMAELYYSIPCTDPSKLDLLKSALVYWEHFMQRLELYGACDKKDLSSWRRETETLNAFTKRAEKIERYKRGKQLDERIDRFYEARSRMLSKINEAEDVFDEEDERSLILTELQRSTIEAIRNRDLAMQEIELIKMMPSPTPHEPRDAKSSPAKSQRPVPARTTNQPLSVMTIGMPKDQVRQEYLSRVFKPFIEMPTISLSEVADWEMQYEAGLGGGEKQSKESDEDNEAEWQAKEYKDRKWDDWKDQNPKGWGNKQRNVG